MLSIPKGIACATVKTVKELVGSLSEFVNPLLYDDTRKQ